MSNIKDFMKAAVEDKPSAAQNAFFAELEPRIEKAMDAKYAEVATSVFNPKPEEGTEQ